MGKDSAIAWTDHTFNPWWGCQRVSAGCENCYAETFADTRFRLNLWGPKAGRRLFGDKHWAEPLAWNKAAEKAGVAARVFCASMSDVGEDREDLVAPRARLVDLVARTPWLRWLLLTKRPQNMLRLFPAWTARGTWPSNVWVGTTVEDRRRAEERIPELLRIPAAVRFLSCEPLLEAIDVSDALGEQGYESGGPAGWVSTSDGISWVIAGGESGRRARPLELKWVRRLIAQCRSANVPIFVKQLGAQPISDDDDDRRHCGDMNLPHPFRLILQDSQAGADESDWPPDLQVRDLPLDLHDATRSDTDAGEAARAARGSFPPKY